MKKLIMNKLSAQKVTAKKMVSKEFITEKVIPGAPRALAVISNGTITPFGFEFESMKFFVKLGNHLMCRVDTHDQPLLKKICDKVSSINGGIEIRVPPVLYIDCNNNTPITFNGLQTTFKELRKTREILPNTSGVVLLNMSITVKSPGEEVYINYRMGEAHLLEQTRVNSASEIYGDEDSECKLIVENQKDNL